MILTDRYITVRSGGGEVLFYQCLSQQLHRLDSHQVSSPLSDRISECVLFIVSKMRENAGEETTRMSADASLEQLFTLLKSMVRASTRSSIKQGVRGYLYASIIQFTQ